MLVLYPVRALDPVCEICPDEERSGLCNLNSGQICRKTGRADGGNVLLVNSKIASVAMLH